MNVVMMHIWALADITQEISNVRNEILTGRGQGGKLKLNNSWDDPDAAEFFDDIINTTYLYE